MLLKNEQVNRLLDRNPGFTFLLFISHTEGMDGIERLLNHSMGTIYLLDCPRRLVAGCAHHAFERIVSTR